MSDEIPRQLSAGQRRVVLAAAFLGWLFAGVEMGLTPLTSRPASLDLLANVASTTANHEVDVGRWFAAYLCAFLLGGAAGGVLFGWFADQAGRVRSLGISILCYSVFTGLGGAVATPEQLLILRFLSGLGIGGTWAAGVPLASEAWPDAARPRIAGALGMAANVGILMLALIGQQMRITPDTWRVAMWAGGAPCLLGIAVLAFVPESLRWREERLRRTTSAIPTERTFSELMRPPLRRRLLIGVGLATIPLLGTWSSGKWMIPWADKVGADQALTQGIWASGAVLGSALGGWLAALCGRRTTYFVVSLVSLVINVSIYSLLHPQHALFLPAVFALGLVATTFFGWLPLYLPELFPTRVRGTGSGITFNLGRIAAAMGVLVAGGLMQAFDGDYARVGAVTAWVYGLGMLLILFAPDTSRETLS